MKYDIKWIPIPPEHDELFAAIAKNEYKSNDAIENGAKVHDDCHHGVVWQKRIK